MSKHERSDESLADRRPLASRNTVAAQRFARLLASTSITPNQISAASVFAALIACVCFYATAQSSSWQHSAGFILAAFACQLRLLCNLMDGMVAIEAGKQTADGAVWNELPDRIADILVFVGVGYAAGWPSLGWSVAALAVFVSYVRELGKGIDGVVDFSGPMAKPHRMALVTVAAVIAAVLNLLPIDNTDGQVSTLIMTVGLWVLAVGCVLTLFRRTRSMLLRLKP
ncbi:MAG: CDP-alcohol phosphatidyltransferase family protein [Granulosicoccus sp.]